MIERKPLKSSIEAVSNVQIKNENISITGQIKQYVSETVDALLKPEHMQEQINPNLLVKKKERKKKQELHL